MRDVDRHQSRRIGCRRLRWYCVVTRHLTRSLGHCAAERKKLVMPGLVPGIHVLSLVGRKKNVDARDKPGHDGEITEIGRKFVIAAPRG
jgi:hypothetical protein